MTGTDEKNPNASAVVESQLVPSTPQKSPYGDISKIDPKEIDRRREKMYQSHSPPVYTLPSKPPPAFEP